MSEINVIIVNFNGGDDLVRAVQSCLEAGVCPGDIIVVDNGSSDASLTRARRLAEIQVIANDCNAGFARAVNQGIARSTAEFLLFLNNDAHITKSTLLELLSCIKERPRAAFVGARLVDQNGRPQNVVADFPRWWMELLPNFLRLFRAVDPKMQNVSEPVAVPSLIGAAFLARREVLDTVGLLDEDFFFYLEETEWCYRARRFGYEVLFCPKALVTHRLGGTANRYRASARIEFHRSRLLYAKKVEGKYARVALVPIFLISTLVNFVSNSIVSLVTLFLLKKSKNKAGMYGKLLLWHILGRPGSWGLPNKCDERGR